VAVLLGCVFRRKKEMRFGAAQCVEEHPGLPGEEEVLEYEA